MVIVFYLANGSDKVQLKKMQFFSFVFDDKLWDTNPRVNSS